MLLKNTWQSDFSDDLMLKFADQGVYEHDFAVVRLHVKGQKLHYKCDSIAFSDSDFRLWHKIGRNTEFHLLTVVLLHLTLDFLFRHFWLLTLQN